MLTDPENYEEWAFEIWARDYEAACLECQQMADKAGLTEVQNVTQSMKTPSRYGNYLFICWFKSEVTDDDSNDN